MGFEVYQIPSGKKSGFFKSLSVNTNLILINVIFFVLIWGGLQLEFFSPDFFNKNVAISLENIQELRIWTFFTSMFMHGGFFHLFANMFSLFFIGGLIEKILGKKRYFLFYFLSGIFASFLYLFFEILFPSGLGAVGASGALFGLIGLLMLLTPDLSVYLMLIPIPIKMKYAAPGILILLWLISIGGNIPIGNTAHLGGLIAGLFYGVYLKNKFPRKTAWLRRQFR
jgi:membrane associated rhomboid family serine protease